MMNAKTMSGGWHRAVIPLLVCCLLLVVTLRCEAQGNLIFNPSFELVDDCPEPPIMGYGPGQRPSGWFTVNSSPDYFNRCQPYGNAGGVPLNTFGWQEPLDGDAYSGMYTYFHNGSLWHELIGSELLEPLMVGVTYYVSFHINAAAAGSLDWPMLASSHYGALFTTDAVEWVNPMPSYPLRNYAHVYHPEVMSDTASWLLVSESFVADSAYRYIVLGNHFDNAHSEADTIITQDSSAFLYRAYTYVDQVCVSLDPQGCPLTQGMIDHSSGGMALYPNPAVDALSIVGLRPGAGVMVVDAIGRVFWEVVSRGAVLDLDVGSWGRGWYAAVVHDGSDRRSFKFVLTE